MTEDASNHARWPRARKVLHHLYVAAVVASIIHLFNRAELPLELPATILLASVAEIYVPAPPQDHDARRHLAVLELNEAHYQKKYEGASPLNRCAMASDLTTLLANQNLRVLAIDFDLSPIDAASYQEEWDRVSSQRPGDMSAVSKPPCQSMRTTQARCQCELERVLAEPANGERIITITPLSPTQGRKKGEAWASSSDFPHVEFGDSELSLRFGMVYDYLFPPDGYVGAGHLPLAELVARRLCSEPRLLYRRPDGCHEIPRPERPASIRAGAESDNRAFLRRSISFFETRHLHNGGRPLTFGDPCLAGPQPYNAETRHGPCDIRFVLFGGSYGLEEDRYLTPLGKRTGVQAHAAIAAQMRAHTRHYWGFVGDVFLGGLVFGPFVHAMWRRYFEQRAPSAPRFNPWQRPKVVAKTSVWQHPKVAYRWLFLLFLFFVPSLLILVYLCAELYARFGIWVSPLPVALAILVEAMVSGSVHSANDVLEEAHASGNRKEPEPAKWLAVAAGRSPRFIAILLVLYTLFKLIHEH